MTENQQRSTGVAIVEALAAHGVEVVFGIPGTHNIEIYRGLTLSGIKHVVPRHEQGAAYGADGYSRSSGRPGVLVTTSGPGITNAITGLANAYADSIPVLAISPGIPSGLERLDSGWMHEVKDQRAAVDSVVSRSVRPSTPEQAVAAIYDIFARWQSERPRPVHLEIPHDVLVATYEGPIPAPHVTVGLPAPSPESVVAASGFVRAAERVVIVAGGGSVGHQGAVTALAEALDAPVFTTTMGKGSVDESHPLAVGPFALTGPGGAELAAADCLIVLGSTLASPGIPAAFKGSVIRVDIDPTQLHKNARADVAVLADIGQFCAALGAAARADGADARGGAAFTQAARSRVQEAFLGFSQPWADLNRALQAALPEDTIVTGDSSQVSYLGTAPFWRAARPRTYVTTEGFATLGYGVPAAIGAQLANPGRPVVAVLGDGALMFSVQELITAAELRLPIVVVVADNQGYAEIRSNMVDAQIEPLAVDLMTPDFVGLAQALHCRGVRADTIEDLGRLAAEALAHDVPTLIVHSTTGARA